MSFPNANDSPAAPNPAPIISKTFIFGFMPEIVEMNSPTTVKKSSFRNLKYFLTALDSPSSKSGVPSLNFSSTDFQNSACFLSISAISLGFLLIYSF